jgi:hypothetical protein
VTVCSAALLANVPVATAVPQVALSVDTYTS